VSGTSLKPAPSPPPANTGGSGNSGGSGGNSGGSGGNSSGGGGNSGGGGGSYQWYYFAYCGAQFGSAGEAEAHAYSAHGMEDGFGMWITLPECWGGAQGTNAGEARNLIRANHGW